MKKTSLYLCALVGASLILGGCANHHTADADTSRHGLVGPGSVAPVSGGPAGPRQPKAKFQP